MQLLLGLKLREFHEKVLQRRNKVTLEEVQVQLEFMEPGRANNTKVEKLAGGTLPAVGAQQNAGAGAKGGGKAKGGDKTADAQAETGPCGHCWAPDHEGGFYESKQI